MLNTMAVNDKPNFTFCHGDITKPRQVLSCLESFKIDTIFHFAAQSHVDLSFGNSYGFTHTNVYGTHVLLESAKQAGVKRFIHVSTDEVYGEVKDDDDDLLESSILSPSNPYAASKAAAEMLVHSYQKSFKLPVIIVRSNNVYGPHQYPESEQFHIEYRRHGPSLTFNAQKLYPNSYVSLTVANRLLFMATGHRHGDTCMPVMRLTRSIRFCTRGS